MITDKQLSLFQTEEAEGRQVCSEADTGRKSGMDEAAKTLFLSAVPERLRTIGVRIGTHRLSVAFRRWIKRRTETGS